MEKILSVCIPTYNMEALLPRCLDSFILEKEYMDQLEIIIVNDGSRDKSSAIAHEYADKYPQTYIVIDKPNGNYGSCVNAALKVATGKYFRICDADDCYKNSNLREYIEFLTTTEADIVFTPYSIYKGDELSSTFVVPAELCGEIFSIDELKWDSSDLKKFRAMHAMTTKRSILVDNNYFQTEGISYTDTQFIFYSYLYAKTCAFLNLVIYNYYLGRDGQTMSKESMIKSHMHFYENAKRMVDEYLKIELYLSDNKAMFLELCILACYRFYAWTVLFDLPYQGHKIKLLKDLLNQIDKTSRGFPTENILLQAKPYKLWRKRYVPAMIINISYRLRSYFRK